MGEKEKLNQQLIDKMNEEQDKYRDWLTAQPPEEILNHAYEYTVREDILMAMESLDLKDNQIQVLLMSESPLADIYKDFLKIEGDHMEIVSSCIETRANDLIEMNYRDKAALKTPLGFVEAHRTDDGISFAVYDVNLKEIESGVIEDSRITAYEAAEKVWYENGLSNVILEDRDELLKRVQETRNSVNKEKEEPKEEKPAFSPVYLKSGEYARAHGELDAFRESYKANIACRDAIVSAIHDNYRDNCLNSDAIYKSVVGKFGAERVAHVLANTVRHKDWDGRISDANKQWAQSVPMAACFGDRENDKSVYYVVDQAHVGLTDLLVTRFRKEQAKEKELPSIREQLKSKAKDIEQKTPAAKSKDKNLDI